MYVAYRTATCHRQAHRVVVLGIVHLCCQDAAGQLWAFRLIRCWRIYRGCRFSACLGRMHSRTGLRLLAGIVEFRKPVERLQVLAIVRAGARQAQTARHAAINQ